MFRILTKIKSEILVGLLIVAGVGGLIYSSIKVTGFNNFSQKGYQLEVIFDDVAGLSEKTAVRLAGIQIGTIEQIKLKNNKASITLYIFEQYQIPDDSVAKIQTLGLLGDKYIEILAGDSIEVFQNNDEITTSTGKNLDDVIGNAAEITESLLQIIRKNEKSIDEIVENIRQVSASLQRITTQNEQKINELIENVNQSAASLKRITTTNEQKISEFIENANQTAASLKRITTTNEQKISELIENLREFSTELSDISKENSLQGSLNNIESITQKIDEGEGTLGQLVNETETVDKINKALDDISGLLGGASRWKYDVGFQTNYLTQQKEFNSDFLLTINTQKDRFYQLKLTDSVRGKITDTETIRTTTTSTDVSTTTIKEREKTDDYLISLLIGKRFYDTQFRIGFLENTFGIGVDQFLGQKDQWILSSEIFQFGQEGALLRLDSTYRYKALHFRLGLDDIINSNPDKRDFTVGIGLHFNEDDLRILGASAVTGITR